VNENELTVCKWGSKVLSFDKRSATYKSELLQEAKALSDLFRDEFGIALFVSYGVLLGFTRGDGFIAHDDDFDFAYISAHEDKAEIVAESARIIEKLIDSGFEINEASFGQYKVWKRTTGLVSRSHWALFKFEIFVGWRENQNAFLYFGIDQPVPVDVFLPLRRQDFLGVTLAVPNKPEAICEAIYGKNWRIPDPGFRYSLSRAQWARFSFLFTSQNRLYWEAYYRGKHKKQPWSVLPSQFAAFIANEIKPCRLLEVGCGNGRDSLFFSSAGFEVVAADYSAAAVELCRTRSEESGMKLEVVKLNVYNLSQVIRFIAQSSTAFDTVYARFFLHAISQIGERNFWRLSANVLKPAGKCCVEFRTDRDVRAHVGAKISENERSDGHYRRFINLEQVMA